MVPPSQRPSSSQTLPYDNLVTGTTYFHGSYPLALWFQRRTAHWYCGFNGEPKGTDTEVGIEAEVGTETLTEGVAVAV
ncbi:hypothetical protein L1887_05983 [Cichorium endivia]|nr:hypothetical protein L1887_05983 [Cichorium endivia]